MAGRLLKNALLTLAVGLVSGNSAIAADLRYSAPQPFDMPRLINTARQRARAPFVAAPTPSPQVLEQINYDAHGKLRFKSELAPFQRSPGRFPLTFFHLGRFFQAPVRMHLIDRGQAREIEYDSTYFEMPLDSPARALGANSGFAGFRFQERHDGALPWRQNDWVAFLGASYFRAIGDAFQYGLSARGVAVNTAVAGVSEEFPGFTDFYFETPKRATNQVTVYALLDGPSLSGAYAFVITRGKAVTMSVDATLFVRKDIARLGLAPLTSMYWYSETTKQAAVDWRPEVHDSDGLALATGTGERLFRPLNNPTGVRVSAFIDENPRGFGLSQRDRSFDHYLDGVRYERRPSAWVSPSDQWGKGSVQLIELPTDDETSDNIVAMWVPEKPAKAGDEYRMRYELSWQAMDPPPAAARVVATRLGRPGQPGVERVHIGRKVVVEFLGGKLASLPFGVIPKWNVTASSGQVSQVRVEALASDVPGHWHVQFDITPNPKQAGPIELRGFLEHAGQALSETWLYQLD